MPFKSEAQRDKFKALVAEGKMQQSVYDEWEAETGSEKLPKRLGTKKETKEPESTGRKW